MQTLTIKTQSNEQPVQKVEPTAEYIRSQLHIQLSKKNENLADMQEVDRWFVRECIQMPKGGLALESL